MVPRFSRLTVLTAAALAVLTLLGGCNLVRRGDLHKSQEDALFFTSFGFLVADNPGLLYRNAVTEIRGTDTYIEITIPYFRDDVPTTPLVPDIGNELAIAFDLVAKDAVVYEGGTPVSQGDLFTFHDGVAPLDRVFTIEKTDPVSGSIDSRSFTVAVRKDILPRANLIQHPLYDDAPIGPPKPAVALDLHFVDEQGSTVPITGADDPIFNDGIDNMDGIDDDLLWVADSSGFGEDELNKDIQVDFTTWAVNPDTAEHYIADTRLYNQGAYQLAIPDDIFYFRFVDADGYECRVGGGVQNTAWVSDAIYMASWGSAGASGLTKTDPVPTLAEAMAAMATAVGGGDPRFEIRVAEGDYNLGAGFTIDTNVSILGGYTNDFSSRWNMEDIGTRHAHATRFYGVPPAGTDVANVSGLLTWEPTGTDIFDTSVLDGVVIFAARAADGGQDWTSALVLRNGPAAEVTSPEIRNSTFVGGGGGFQNSFGVALQDAGMPLLYNNYIISAEEGTNDTTAGLLVNQGGRFIAIGNIIIGEESDADNSYGIRMISAQGEVVANQILAGVSLPSDSIGISAVSCSYLRVHANDIETQNAAVASCGISLEIPTGEHFVFNNAILAGNGGESVGVRTVDAGGGNYEVLNNAIRTGSGAARNNGLYITGTVPGTLEFANNLVDSSASDLVALETAAGLNASAAGLIARGNAYDDSDHDVQIMITGDSVYLDAADAQDSFPNLVYNIEQAFQFDDGGRITSGLDENLAYGGISGWMVSSEPAPFFLNEDRWGRGRSNQIAYPVDGGWSIGPFEYDQADVAYPAAIHVAEGRGVGGPGSDMHLLGTADFPFEFLSTGYNVAVDRSIAGDLWLIRLAEGVHSVGNLTLNTDVVIQGGWRADFATRNVAAYPSVISGATPGILYIDSVSDRFRLEGVTLRNDLGANVSLVTVQNSAWPVLRDLVFEAAPTNTGYTGLTVQTGATPQVYNCDFDGAAAAGNTENVVYNNAGGVFRNNQIFGGAPTGGSTWGIRVANSAWTEIHSNQIIGGSPVVGGATMVEVTGGSPYIHDNVLTGGNPQGIAYGLSWTAASGGLIHDNTIFSGDSNASDAAGVHVSGIGANPELTGNRITAGGGPGSMSWGIRSDGGAAPYIHHNDIFSDDSGGTTDVYGMEVVGAPGISIHDNIIEIGLSANYAAGIYLLNCSTTTVYDNGITGGSAVAWMNGIHASGGSDNSFLGNTMTPGPGVLAWGFYGQNETNMRMLYTTVSGGFGDTTGGIYMSSCNNALLDSNRIFGGEGGIDSTGLYIQNSNNVGILNNLIHGGTETGGEKRGVRIIAGDNLVSLSNNTIYAGRGGVLGAAVHLEPTAAPRMVNNFIIAGAAAGENLGVWQQSNILPARFLHNIILGAEPGFIPYRDDIGTDYPDGIAIDGYFGGPSIDYDVHLVEPAENPTAYLVRFTNDGDRGVFLNDNWDLSGGGSLNARFGGLALDADAVRPFNDDITGNSRSVAWSIGAYEY